MNNLNNHLKCSFEDRNYLIYTIPLPPMELPQWNCPNRLVSVPRVLLRLNGRNDDRIENILNRTATAQIIDWLIKSL